MNASRKITVTYLFDPLCGWCYGAAPSLRRLKDLPGIALTMAPTGLFSGSGARLMDAGFAAYAWGNDKRIAALSGQPFSDAYREKVLNAADGRFDSGPATLALCAVWRLDPQIELDALEAVQHARFVRGLDVTSPAILAGCLDAIGLTEAARAIAKPDEELATATRARVAAGARLMAAAGARGVPALVANAEQAPTLLRTDGLYSGFENLISALQAA